MKENFIDKAISFISPNLGLERMRSKIRIEALRSYAGATKGKAAAGWKTASLSANQEIERALVTLRNRSRDLARNNPYARNALRIFPNNVVGTGIIPEPITVSGRKLNAKLKTLWKAWAENTDADYDGRLTVYGIQKLVTRSMQESGECFVVRRYRRNSSGKLQLTLQILEADYLDTSKHESYRTDGGLMYYGIEFGTDGRRKQYWFYDKHPNESYNKNSVAVPAEDVIHIYEIERPGQIRGVPFSASSMLRINDLDDYESAERIRQKLATAFTAFVTGNEDSDGKFEADYGHLEPGTIKRLKNGESVSFSNPPNVNSYDPYVKNQLRAISTGNGITYEALTNDYSNVNFSSGRMGWIEFNKNVQDCQYNILIPLLCHRLFDWFIYTQQLNGTIPMNAEYSATWTAPRREMIDPYKEAMAYETLLSNGITSLPEVHRELGNNPEEVLNEIYETHKQVKENGIELAFMQPSGKTVAKKDTKEEQQ